jgi:exosortase
MSLIGAMAPLSATARTGVYAAFCAGVGLASLPVLRALVEHSRNDETASHLILIPFVSVVLVYLRKEAIFSSVRFDTKAGLVASLGVVGLVLATYRPMSDLRESLSLAVASVVMVLAAGFLAVFGRQAFLAALFPILFLAFMIPIPAPVLALAIDALKRGSTEMVAILFSVTATPFHREGFVFSLPNLVIEVADACSGIRSSIALVLTSLLAGYMYLHTAWRRTALLFAVIPLVIVKNGVRIVALTLLAIHVDREFLVGRLHNDGGIIFFLVSVGLLTLVLTLLRRSEAVGILPLTSARPSPRLG